MSNTTLQPPVSKSRPVRTLFAVAAGAAVLAGGLPQITPDDWDWIGGAVGLVGLVITAAVTKFTEDKTVPYANAKAIVNDETGETVAGPAADLPTGTVVQEPKALTPQV